MVESCYNCGIKSFGQCSNGCVKFELRFESPENEDFRLICFKCFQQVAKEQHERLKQMQEQLDAAAALSARILRTLQGGRLEVKDSEEPEEPDETQPAKKRRGIEVFDEQSYRVREENHEDRYHRQREPRTRVRSDSEHPLGREVGECAREVTESLRREELEIVTALAAGRHAVQVWKDHRQRQNSSSAGVDESPRGKLAWYRMDADLKSFKEDLNIQ